MHLLAVSSQAAKRVSDELARVGGSHWVDVQVDSGVTPLICIGIVGEPAPLVEVRHNLERWAARTGLSTLVVGDLVLASYEALANAIEHAYPRLGGVVDLVAVRTADNRVLVAVRDHGQWRPPQSDPGSRGRGLPMIKALAHRAEVQHGAHGTVVHMEWHLSATE